MFGQVATLQLLQQAGGDLGIKDEVIFRKKYFLEVMRLVPPHGVSLGSTVSSK